MEAEINRRPGSHADQTPGIEVMWVKHRILHKQDERLHTGDGAWMKNRLSVLQCSAYMTDGFQVLLVASALGESGTRNGKNQSQHPVVDRLHLTGVSAVDIVYRSVEARLVEDRYQLEMLVEVVLQKLGGHVMWWEILSDHLGQGVLGARREDQAGIRHGASKSIKVPSSCIYREEAKAGDELIDGGGFFPPLSFAGGGSRWP